MHFCSNPIGNSHCPLRVQFRKIWWNWKVKIFLMLLAISVAHRKNDHFNNIDLLKFFSKLNSYRAMAFACWAYFRWGPAEKGGLQKIKNVEMINFSVGNAYCQLHEEHFHFHKFFFLNWTLKGQWMFPVGLTAEVHVIPLLYAIHTVNFQACSWDTLLKMLDFFLPLSHWHLREKKLCVKFAPILTRNKK